MINAKVFKDNILCKMGFLAVVAAAILAITVCGFGRSPASADDTATEQAPLAIELPQPYLGGTPSDYNSEHLEERTWVPRPPFLAPAGATNLAKGKPVTSSCSNPNYGKLSQITDGEKNYQPANCVELAAGMQWVQIDLGQKSELYAVLVWHQHNRDNVYFDVVVRAASDPEFHTGVHTLFNNDFDNSSGIGVGKDKEYFESYEGRLIDAKDVHGRYVRLYSNGNAIDDLNHYVEVEVYGKPAADE